MSITNPEALLLLALLPLAYWIGRPRSRFRRRRAIISALLRMLLIALLVLSLAGIEIPGDSDQLAVVFLVDYSDSMGQANREAAVDYVEQAIESMNANRDQAAVIFFGANAVVEQPLAPRLDLSQTSAAPITLNTNLAEAIRLGLALFPAEGAKRLVILSDGVETVGDAERASRLAAASNVQIDYVPFTQPQNTGEILIEDVRVPQRVNESELFDLIVNVESQVDSPAELRVFAGGSVIYQTEVELESGDNRFSVGPLDLPSTGFVDFRVQIEPRAGGDTFYQNNELAAFTEVRGRPTVLLVANDQREVEFLQPALEETGLVVEVIAPRDLPTGLAGLSAYSSVVLVDVPATKLNTVQMELLQIYVRELGGGLVAIGGPNAYGVGGYFETPLEETLPVEMRIRDQQRIPSLTMLFIIDRSGSMEMVSGASGFTNLELAKEAILRSFNFLNDYDRAGVISFDTEAYYVLPIQEMQNEANRRAMQNEVASLRSGGGTDIFGALEEASNILPTDPSALKHMILLSDGGASPMGILELAQQMYEQHGITISVVSVGTAAAGWLPSLAQVGRGNFHQADDVSTIPSIFAQETVLATRSYIIEEEFTPSLTARSQIMEGITVVPSLLGYVATTEKDTATVVLRTPEEDPLLATWQYGLGRAVAFTSDASPRWGVNWLTWEDYTRFWSQTVRWTITEGASTNLEVRVEQRGEQAYLIVDARDEDGEFLNGVTLDAALVNPELESETVSIPQVAPGRYETPISPEQEGAYFLRVAGSTASGSLAVAQTAGWVLSYSSEYALREPNPRFLEELAGLTGGGSLAENPAAAFEHDLVVTEASEPIWQVLLALAACLLVLDIAVRRLVINPSDVEALRAWLGRTTGLSRGRVPSTAGRMGNLMEAKRRAATLTDDQSVPPVQAEAPATPAATAANLRRDKTQRTEAARGQQGASKSGDASATASALLKKKRGDD
ncbi:MAG: VWA domain-containing protein [Anaerolineae bacterium]|nr:VWA domain-containing protein [Anaerolineae bacterium]